MNTSESQFHDTSRIRSARQIAICSVITFLLANLYGAAPANYLLSGVFIGALFLVSLILNWRTQRDWLRVVAFLIIILGHKLALHVLPSESYPQFFQWLSLTWFTAAIPIWIFPSLVIKLCGLRTQSSSTPP